MFVMVLLSPCYIQLVVMRVREYAELDLKEQEKERREKEEREKVSILPLPEFVFLCFE